MNWQNVKTNIGVVTGLISIVGVIYGFGFKVGQLDTKVSTLWEFFVGTVITAHKTVDQGNSANPGHNNPHPTIALPQSFVDAAQRITAENSNKDVTSIVSLIMQELAINQKDKMNVFISRNNITRADFINLIADEVRKIKGG